MTLWEVAAFLSRSSSSCSCATLPMAARFMGQEPLPFDPAWRDLILFHEYFNGDTGEGLGASHQTGWTALVAKLIEQSGR